MPTLDDIRLGDVVRLRNGETITVRHKMDSYRDREGEHVGPFVASPPALDRFHISDITEVVTRNERVCRFCGEGVTATKPETDYCEPCFYSGRASAEDRRVLIEALERIPTVVSAHIWHTGGGCFVLAVNLTDERLVTISAGDAVPAPGEPWRLMVVCENEDAFFDYDEGKVEEVVGEWSDEQIVAAVREKATA